MLKRVLTVLGTGIAGIFLLLFGFSEFNETRKLAASGRKTTGEVTGFEEKSGRRGRVKYYLTVRFNTESGQTALETSRVSTRVYSDAVQSKQAPVVYLPSKPGICRFAPDVTKDFTGIGIGLFLIGCSVVTGFRRDSVG